MSTTDKMSSDYEDALRAFQLCENFASYHELPVEYIWQEFVDPSIMTSSQVEDILTRF